MDSDSDGERRGEKGKADVNGRYVTAVVPFLQGKTRGTDKVRPKSAGCSPSVSFPWGRRNWRRCYRPWGVLCVKIESWDE